MAAGPSTDPAPEADPGAGGGGTDAEARSLEVLEWGRIREVLAARCSCAPARALAGELAPLRDADAARERLLETMEARLLVGREGAGSPASGLRDLGEVLDRLERRASLEPEDLLDVASVLETASSARRLLESHAEVAPRLAALASELDDQEPLRREIRRCLDPSGTVVDDASKALAEARRRVVRTAQEVRGRLQSIVSDPELESVLQERFFTMREGRYVVPVRREARSSLPGIVHGRSSSEASFFIEPEGVVEANNEHRIAQEEEREEIARILAALTARTRQGEASLAATFRALARIDFAWARGRLADELEATAPELTDRREIHLERARHPLLALQDPEGVVPNDLRLEEDTSFLVVTGPNTGGKTVAMKTAGLAVLMARAGLAVPAAEGGRLHPFPYVLADLGDEQSLERHLSSFSGHLRRIQQIRRHADPDALVLLDEVVSGTDPQEGAALARALLEDLASKGAHGIVTTHYQELKGLAAEDGRFRNAGMEFDIDRMRPTFRMNYDLPGRSSALAVARRLGLDEQVVARAEELHGEAGVRLDALLEEVETLRRRVDEERAEAARIRKEAERLESERSSEIERLRKRDREILGDAEAQLAAELARAREQASGAARRLERETRRARVEEERRRLKEIEERARRKVRELDADRESPEIAAGAEELSEGDDVWLRRWSKRATVAGPPEGEKVPVMVGVVRMEVPLDEVEPLAGRESAGSGAAPRRRSEPQEVASEEIPFTSQRAGNTLDLRGKSVDESLDAIDRFLDRCLERRVSPVILIHGHGTGTLRRAVREHLADSPYARDYRAGGRGEGEDGVTVVRLS